MEEKDLKNELPAEEESTEAPVTESVAPEAEEQPVEAATEPAAEQPAEAAEVAEEKESTQELREAYEEATEDGKKKKKKKKRKKMSKKKIALIVVASFFLALALAVGLFFLIGTLLAEKYVPIDVTFTPAKPLYASSFTGEETNKIEVAMAPGATEDQIKDAIASMYYRANQNKIHADQAIAVLRGEGKATINIAGQKPSGTMIVRGIKASYGDTFYYQKAAKVVKCSIPALQDIIQNSLNQQERAYTNFTNINLLSGTLKGKKAKIEGKETATIPFLQIGNPDSFTKYNNFNDFKEHGYYLEDPREITNFKIVKDYIVLKDLEAGQSYIEYDAEQGLYTLRFSLTLEAGEDHEDCVYYSRKYLRDSSNSSDLDFKRYDVVLEIWDNGYLRKMHDDEMWCGNLSGTYTESTTWYESIVYYDFDQAIFSEEDLARYAGEEGTVVDEVTGETTYTVTDGIQKVLARYYNDIKDIKRKNG